MVFKTWKQDKSYEKSLMTWSCAGWQLQQTLVISKSDISKCPVISKFASGPAISPFIYMLKRSCYFEMDISKRRLYRKNYLVPKFEIPLKCRRLFRNTADCNYISRDRERHCSRGGNLKKVNWQLHNDNYEHRSRSDSACLYDVKRCMWLNTRGVSWLYCTSRSVVDLLV